jgi:sentrin-specific protease 1
VAHTSPAVNVSPAPKKRTTPHAASSPIASSSAPEPSKEPTSPKKEIFGAKSPEFPYFSESRSPPRKPARPTWISQEEFDAADYKLKHAEENAKKLRELAKKEKAAQREAYEAYRTPPVTVARVPVEWPKEEEWMEIEARTRFGTDSETLVLQTGGEQCSRRDLQFLLDQEWLSDVCINAYVHLLRQRAKAAMTAENSPAFPKTYLFGSFLLDSLCNGPNGYNYNAVRRVTTRAKVDIFAMDKILVPYHLGNHWTMACINFTLKRFEYYDALGGLSKGCINALRQYLNDEWKDKKSDPNGFDTSQWPIFHPSNIPHQRNGYDCGVFALTYANYLSRNKPFDFTQDDMPAIRAHILIAIINNEPLPLTN